MKLLFLPRLLVVTAGFSLIASCQNPEPRSVLEKAIAAHGGEKNIAKPRMGVLKGTNKSLRDQGTQEETFDLPKRWKRVTTVTFEGKRADYFVSMTEGKLWEWEEGAEPQEVKNPADTGVYVASLAVLLDLTGEKVKLSSLGSKKTNGQSTIGLRATWDGGAGDYYFDKVTSLLVQTESKWRPEPGKEADLKQVFGDYKEIDGVKVPHRRSAYIKTEHFKDYVLLNDFTVTEVRILDKLPDDAFALPKKK